MTAKISDRELREAIEEKLSVPLWPHAGQALGLKRGATYAAAATGNIVTVDVSRKKNVSTAWLKTKLNLKTR
jgi:hypothetical protein